MNAAFFKSKRFILIALAVVLVAGGVAAAVIFTRGDGGMTIRALAGNDIEQRRPRDYKDSRLYLYGNGTFTVKVVYLESIEFVGIGTYVKDGNTYIFTYKDMARRIGFNIQRDDANANATYTYNVSGGHIEVQDPNYRSYFFK